MMLGLLQEPKKILKSYKKCLIHIYLKKNVQNYDKIGKLKSKLLWH